MRGHHITGSESLLLRTPVADEDGGGPLSPAMAKAKGQTLRLSGQIIDLVDPERLPKPLLPTVVTTDANGTRNSTANRRHPEKAHKGDTLTDIFVAPVLPTRLLPTPNTMDHLPARSPEKIAEFKERTPGGYANVREIVVNDVDESWGKFAPAIKRWEQVTRREAPAPTKPDGKDGQHRLSAEFTEWMMGLPHGWVTSPDIGLTRNEALKACGNGVVPQQAVLALRMLLDGVNIERERERDVMLPTPTVSDIFTDKLNSTQQKDGSMHSVTLPQAVRMIRD